MSQQSAEKRRMLPFLHLGIMIAVIVLFSNLPPMGEITGLGMRILGIFIALVYGWSTVGLTWPSLLIIVILGFLGNNTMFGVFATAFGDKITISTFFVLVFAGLVEQTGLSAFIANWCTSRSFVQGKPWGMALMFWTAALLIGATVNIFAAIILVTGIFYRFCEQVGFQKKDKYPTIVIVGIAYCATLSNIIFPFMGLSFLTIMQMKLYVPGAVIDFLPYTMVQFILVLASVIFFWGIAVAIFKPDVSLLTGDMDRFQEYRDAKMNGEQKQALGLLLVLIGLLFAPSVLPGQWAITVFFKRLDVIGAVTVVLILYYLINLGNKEVLSFGALAKGVNWEVVLMFAAVAPLTAAMTTPESGILPFIAAKLGSIVSGMSPFIFIATLMAIASVITQFANNAAIALIVSPVMYTLTVQLGVNPAVMTVIAAFCLNIAFCTPAASGPAALIFSNREWIKTRDAYCFGFIIFFINLLVTFLGIPIAQWLM